MADDFGHLIKLVRYLFNIISNMEIYHMCVGECWLFKTMEALQYQMLTLCLGYQSSIKDP